MPAPWACRTPTARTSGARSPPAPCSLRHPARRRATPPRRATRRPGLPRPTGLPEPAGLPRSAGLPRPAGLSEPAAVLRSAVCGCAAIRRIRATPPGGADTAGADTGGAGRPREGRAAARPDPVDRAERLRCARPRLAVVVARVLLLPAVSVPPLTPDGDEARRWAEEELADPAYDAAQPTAIDRVARAIGDFFESLFATQLNGDWGPWAALIAAVVIILVIIAAFLVWGVPRATGRAPRSTDAVRRRRGAQRRRAAPRRRGLRGAGRVGRRRRAALPRPRPRTHRARSRRHPAGRDRARLRPRSCAVVPGAVGRPRVRGGRLRRRPLPSPPRHRGPLPTHRRRGRPGDRCPADASRTGRSARVRGPS